MILPLVLSLEISGSVTITNPEVDPASGLVELPEEVIDPTEQVIARCALPLKATPLL